MTDPRRICPPEGCAEPLLTLTSPDDIKGLSTKPGRKRLHKTASDRQRAYRRRVLGGQSGIATTTDDPGQGATRLDLYLSATAASQLDRLARRGGMSRAQVLGVLLSQAEAHVLKTMTDDEQDDYIIG
ncbi:MAG: ribbon-helix-helix domain-containing protein [Acidiferrobacter sp.]